MAAPDARGAVTAAGLAVLRAARRRAVLLASCAAFWLAAGGQAGAESQGPDGTAPVPPAAAEGGPRRFEAQQALALLKAPQPGAAPVTQLAQGAVVENVGCARHASSVWCAVRPLLGGPRGFAPLAALRPAEGPDGRVAMGADSSPDRARPGDFDAEAKVACAQERGAPLGLCAARVARGTGGDATVEARFANGFRRTLFFRHGRFVRASATMSGTGRDIDWQQNGTDHHIRVDDQRFVLPADFLFGPSR